MGDPVPQARDDGLDNEAVEAVETGEAVEAVETGEDGEAGTVDSALANTASVNKVSVLHGLLISGIELALTLANAVNQDAFQLNSFSALVFGGSVVIEAVGFVFAIGMAVRALLCPAAQNVVGVGVPAMVYAEMLFEAGPEHELGDLWLTGLNGLGMQSLCFLVFMVVSWVTSPASLPTVSKAIWISLGTAGGVLLCACYNYCEPAGDTILQVLYVVFNALPFVVEISESALLFTSGSILFVAFLLAVLDLVVIAPATAFSFLMVFTALGELFE